MAKSIIARTNMITHTVPAFLLIFNRSSRNLTGTAANAERIREVANEEKICKMWEEYVEELTN